MKKKNKIQLVEKHLETHKKGITGMVAWERYKVQDLRAVMYKLRKRGWIIESIPHQKDGVQWTQYILVKKGA